MSPARTNNESLDQKLRTSAAWVRGGVSIAADMFSGTVNIVHGVHRAFLQNGPAATPLGLPNRLTTDFVYGRVRDIGQLSFFAARQLAGLSETFLPARSSDVPARLTLGLRSALNGAFGDYLESSENELALSMSLIDDHGNALAITRAGLADSLPAATPRLVILIHGLGMNDQQWRQAGRADFGDRLAAEHGYTALRLRYNSGRHISHNGRDLARLLQTLVEAYPVKLERLTLIGHSMGGLVARSACHYAERDGAAWLAVLQDVICLGSPHLGSPLERFGNRFNESLTRLRYTQPLSALGNIRSAGVKDLRYGYLLDEDWQKDSGANVDTPSRPIPGPDHVGHFLVAATLGRADDDPVGRMFGDLLVPVESAVGYSPIPSRRFNARDQAGRVFYGMNHFALTHHDAVYGAVVEWLAPRLGRKGPSSSYLTQQDN